MQAAAVDSLRKLDPRLMVRNPVMFVVWVGSIVTTIFFVRDLFDGDTSGNENLFAGLVAAWLWFTVLFANFAEAVAEGRGKAQADTLRKARSDTVANRRRPDGSLEPVPSSQLGVDDVVVVTAGEMIPSDGEIIEGIASVDESAITGESAPVIRESGGDRSAVTGGTRVLSDQILVRITARPGETFLDRMISLVEGASRQKTPNEIALNILLAGLTIIFLLATVTLQPFAIYSGAEQTVIIADRPAGVPDPDDDRRPAVGHRHRRHGPAGAAQRARHVGPGRRGGRRLLDAAARQDRHDHARQPPGRRVPAARRGRRGAARRRRPARQPGRRDARGPVDRRAGQGALRHPRARGRARHARALHRPDPHERAGSVDGTEALGAQGRGRLRAPVGARARAARCPTTSTALVEGVATAGGTPLVVAEARIAADAMPATRTAPVVALGPPPASSTAWSNGVEVLGVVHLKDVVKEGMRQRFDQLRAMGIRTVMITGDNPLTAQAIATEAGVDDFLAEATPEDKMALIRREQEGGRLVAMTGDGTNDAPALAQADVGVAMNTGTQAAKEAGNMVDLDSNPTKLIEIVEIGKQLLITRGSLTTFSIANDVAKYFAIIPAMFVGVFPQLDTLNVMDLQSPRSAILSAVIFNALIIVGLIPLALRGVKFRALGAAAVLRRNLLIYGVGGLIAPFVGIKLIDIVITALGVLVMRAQLVAAVRAVLVFTVLLGLAYPLAVTALGQAAFGDEADGSLVRARRRGRRLRAARPDVHQPRVLPRAALGRRWRGLGLGDRHPRRRRRAHRRDDAGLGRRHLDRRRRAPRTSARRTRTSSPPSRSASPTTATRTASTPTPWCPSTPSPRRDRASTRTSRSPTPACRRSGWPTSGGCPPTRCSRWSTTTRRAAASGSSARRASTCWSSTSPSTSGPVTGLWWPAPRGDHACRPAAPGRAPGRVRPVTHGRTRPPVGHAPSPAPRPPCGTM